MNNYYIAALFLAVVIALSTGLPAKQKSTANKEDNELSTNALWNLLSKQLQAFPKPSGGERQDAMAQNSWWSTIRPRYHPIHYKRLPEEQSIQDLFNYIQPKKNVEAAEEQAFQSDFTDILNTLGRLANPRGTIQQDHYGLWRNVLGNIRVPSQANIIHELAKELMTLEDE